MVSSVVNQLIAKVSGKAPEMIRRSPRILLPCSSLPIKKKEIRWWVEPYQLSIQERANLDIGEKLKGLELANTGNLDLLDKIVSSFTTDNASLFFFVD